MDTLLAFVGGIVSAIPLIITVECIFWWRRIRLDLHSLYRGHDAEYVQKKAAAIAKLITAKGVEKALQKGHDEALHSVFDFRKRYGVRINISSDEYMRLMRILMSMQKNDPHVLLATLEALDGSSVIGPAELEFSEKFVRDVITAARKGCENLAYSDREYDLWLKVVRHFRPDATEDILESNGSPKV